MKFRRLELTKTDFEAYNELFYQTEFSEEIGEKSQKNDKEIGVTFEIFKDIYENKKHAEEVFVYADENNIPVGMAIVNFYKKDKICRLDRFTIKQEYQLLGYGKNFYKKLEDYLRNNNIDEITGTCISNGAKVFWEKQGYRLELNEYLLPIYYSKIIKES